MAANRQLWALCVGVNDYGAQPGLPNLSCAVNGACLLYETLVEEYNFQGVLLAHPRDISSGPHASMAKRSEGAGSAEDVIEQINRLGRRARSEDIFFLFYAGHASAQAPACLEPFGAISNKPSTHLMLRTLFGELNALPCRFQAVLLDCCCAGNLLPTPGSAPHSGNNERAVLLASNANPDVALGTGDGRHSPFVTALVEFLKQKVSIGQSFEPEEMFAHVVQETASVLKTVPLFRDELPAVRCGHAPFGLRRPGLALTLQRRYVCNVGEKLVLDAPARRKSAGGAPLEWEISLKNSGFDTGIQKKTFIDIDALRFDYAGEYELEMVVRDPDTEERASASITVLVKEVKPGPLTLRCAQLPICHKGEPYLALLDIAGGVPPYKLEVSGLPPGMTCNWASPTRDAPGHRIRLAGNVPENAAAGTARSPDADPIAFNVRFLLEDSVGNKREEVRRLLVISRKDYCRISGGSFWVGYQPDTSKETAIQRMLAGMVHQVLKVNPGAEVQLTEFYIRKYPVTNLAWREYVHANKGANPPPWIPEHWDRDNPDFFSQAEATLPVVGVPYKAICDYLQWKGTRLPTAWEWERAARDRDGRLFPWGDEFHAEHCNVLDSGVGHLTPVDAYPANCSPDGVCDMVGNAAEWVDRRTYQAGYLYQPFRGGSYLDTCLYALTFLDSREAGVRYGADEYSPEVGETAFGWLGFRDVVDLDPDPGEAQALIPIPQVHLHIGDKNASVPPFAMSRYTVSNLEYWEFVKATGHRFPDGWERNPGDQLPFPMLHRHLPVVGVTYRDALAFCLWKSRVLRCSIRLPTAEQWLAAVDGGKGHRFPWGNQFDLQRCNSLVSGWGKRLPVFALPGGCSPQGIYNLIGNVCEWIDPFELRGGGWQDDCEALARCSFRHVVRQTTDYGFKRRDVGFRYVQNIPRKQTQ
ncbi:MAG: SUMF1/EgtB/PvdO family nonheme iron enzyme [Verrucomicrobia bacterium]|nr:SUMF1/EgtB/PvdO family nonheme iron enzyme [Verrucomicrobiota bacterium]